jgi:hypothetical protein
MFDLAILESVQAFLIKLDMKPCLHLLEISNFSLNHVIIRRIKIKNNILKHREVCIFKVIFTPQELVKSFWKTNSMKNIWLGDQLVWKYIFEILIFKILSFLKLCPIFVGSVHNFGMSDDDKIFVKDAYFH